MQGRLGDIDIYGEQISHNPSISAFLLVSREIRIYASHKLLAYAYPNSIQALSYGNKVIQVFGKIPATYQITNPQIEINGLMFGKRTFKYTGTIIIEDTINNLYALLAFNPIKQGFFASLFSKNDRRPDYIRGFITNERKLIDNYESVIFKDTGHLAFIEGYWIEKLSINGEVTWALSYRLAC